MFFITEMLLEEIKNHIATATVITGIHGHFTKEVFHIRHDNSQRPQSVPKIIQSKQTFASGTGRLVFKRHKRASQFDCLRQIFFNKSIRKMEHVGSSQNRRPFFIKAHICPEQIPISPQNFFRFRVPYN